MKNRKITIVVFIGILIFILLGQLYWLNRTDKRLTILENRMDGVEWSLSKDIESIDNRLRGIESMVEWEQGAQIIDLERKAERLEDILLAVDEVTVAHGTITEMSGDKEWSIEIEFDEDIGEFTVSDEAKAYFVDTIGLTESTMEELKKKFDIEKTRYKESRDPMDTYTFILVKGEILHIYQGRIK